MNEEFKGLAKDIVARARKEMANANLPTTRHYVLSNLKKDLEMLKEAYAIVYTTTEADVLVGNALQS